MGEEISDADEERICVRRVSGSIIILEDQGMFRYFIYGAISAGSSGLWTLKMSSYLST